MKIIYLIGFRGAGKTTLGRVLAKKLNFSFLDCDEIFENKKQITILDFVEKHGERRFREEELSILKEISSDANALDTLIVATGGGFVDFPPSLEWMKMQKHKVFLNVPPNIIWERIGNNKARLAIGGISNRMDLQAFFNKRLPLYRSLGAKEVDLGALFEDDLKRLESIIQVEF